MPVHIVIQVLEGVCRPAATAWQVEVLGRKLAWVVVGVLVPQDISRGGGLWCCGGLWSAVMLLTMTWWRASKARTPPQECSSRCCLSSLVPCALVYFSTKRSMVQLSRVGQYLSNWSQQKAQKLPYHGAATAVQQHVHVPTSVHVEPAARPSIRHRLAQPLGQALVGSGTQMRTRPKQAKAVGSFQSGFGRFGGKCLAFAGQSGPHANFKLSFSGEAEVPHARNHRRPTRAHQSSRNRTAQRAVHPAVGAIAQGFCEGGFV